MIIRFRHPITGTDTVRITEQKEIRPFLSALPLGTTTTDDPECLAEGDFAYASFELPELGTLNFEYPYAPEEVKR